MQEIRQKKISWWGLNVRARAPLVARYLALAALIAGILFASVTLYRRRGVKPFRLKSQPAALSTQVQAIVEGYERVVTEDNKIRMRLRAARDITFTDGHHELEDVHLELYPKQGDKPDQINSRRSIYDDENQLVTFMGDVQIETRDALKVKTENVSYKIKDETAQITTPLTFERENISGRGDAADVDSKNKKLNLRGNVEISVAHDPKKPENKVAARNQPVVVHAAQAFLDQNAHTLVLSGGATAEQERDVLSGDTLTAYLNEQNRVKKIDTRGNSYLRSMNEGRAAEVHSADMSYFFNDAQKIEHAVANSPARDVKARTLDGDSDVTISDTNSIELFFAAAQNNQSLLQRMETTGRPVITLSAPKSKANDPRAANKRLTADDVKLFWRMTGRDLERAEVMGNAELYVEPVQSSPTADKKTVTAPRFDCEFYEKDNRAKTFTATGGAKVVLEPMQPSERRQTRTLTADKMVTNFVAETQDVERFDALGNAKFNEADRNGQSQNMNYTTADATVRLRGGEPVVWDSKARTKANELDSDTNRKISYGRGKVQTTYYSQGQTNGATPFQKVNSPVFIVADRVEFQHDSGIAIYTGNARAWQDDNFVRADKLTLRQGQKRMEGEGNIQSALYRATKKEKNGATAIIPVFATSRTMFYSDIDRLLHYEGDVDIKQDTDRIQSGVADVYLKKDSSEVDHTIARQNVVLTQPGKRGTGDTVTYTASDEVAVLTGNPARVEDTEQGTSQSKRLTMYMRENRVVGDAPPGQETSGRVHSTHKIRQ